jgi:bifunctional DNase/RNase
MPDDEFCEVEVRGVGHDAANRVVVVLKDPYDRELPISIGHCEALAIVQRMSDDFDPPRPLTQDLLLTLFRRLGGSLRSLRIDDLWEMVYYSKLSVEQEGKLIDIDCRPSDGIALALAAGVPIYVADRVMEEGTHPGEEEE